MTTKSMDEEIKKLLEQNLEYSKETYRLTKKIKGYITFQKVMSIIYLLLIVVPIILSIVFLPPLLKGMFNQYKDILGIEGQSGSIFDVLKGSGGNIDLNNIDSEQVKKYLNSPR